MNFSSIPWLFTYGTLGPRFSNQAADWKVDHVRGRLFDLGPYPALIDCNDPNADWVEGHLRPVSEAELVNQLDPYEGVDEGLFQRSIVQTRQGVIAWVYVYAQPLPANAIGPIVRW